MIQMFDQQFVTAVLPWQLQKDVVFTATQGRKDKLMCGIRMT